MHGLRCREIQELDGLRCNFQPGFHPLPSRTTLVNVLNPYVSALDFFCCCSCLATVFDGCAVLPSQGSFRLLCLKCIPALKRWFPAVELRSQAEGVRWRTETSALLRVKQASAFRAPREPSLPRCVVPCWQHERRPSIHGPRLCPRPCVRIAGKAKRQSSKPTDTR